MRGRFLILLAAATLAATPAVAQVRQPPGGPAQKEWIEPPTKLPKAEQGDPTRNLDFLFEALKIAPDEGTAKQIEQRIWALWFISPSDTANLLMTRVRTAVEQKDTDLALELLDKIIAIKPDYVEAWNRRATIYFMKNDYGKSLADIREVLKREPRHFGALSGLGLILEETGRKDEALEVFRRALEINPQLESVKKSLERLEKEIEGDSI